MPFLSRLHDPGMFFGSWTNSLPVLPGLLSSHLCKLGWPKHNFLGLIKLRSAHSLFLVNFWPYLVNFFMLLHPCLCKPVLAGQHFPAITNHLHPWNSPKKTILGPSVSPDNIPAFEKQHILLKSHFGKNTTIISPFELFSGILFPNGRRKLGRKWGENVGVEEHPVLHKYFGVLSDGCSALNRRGLMLAKAK